MALAAAWPYSASNDQEPANLSSITVVIEGLRFETFQPMTYDSGVIQSFSMVQKFRLEKV